ncbi:hypothetical protein OS123_10665 [Corynebacterium sp. P5875]|uniref:Uncharacterized protein n=1 Tax=Corynebacterium antarcticum TaxID=2800405 RepID=A0A9Q4CDQ6_9CORY|nr:hypothetical protein [Corynebacterium antarcticum]MCX7538996.1 hypothetical protein [Corynebacterium antarcticum]
MTDTNGRDGSNGRGDQIPGGTGGGRDPWGDVPPESDVFAHGATEGAGWGNGSSDPTPTQQMPPVGTSAAAARAPQQITATQGPVNGGNGGRRKLTGVVIGFLIVVIIAALSVIALGFTVLGWGSSGESGPTSSGGDPVVVETTVVTLTTEPDSSATTSTPTSTSSTTRATTSTTTTGTTTSTKTTEAKPKFTVPEGSTGCGDSGGFDVYSGTDVTSCGFAMAVGGQIAGQGGNSPRDISAVSPVTGRSYRMKCTPKGAGAWVCRGGDNAVVYVAPRAR